MEHCAFIFWLGIWLFAQNNTPNNGNLNATLLIWLQFFKTLSFFFFCQTIVGSKKKVGERKTITNILLDRERIFRWSKNVNNDLLPLSTRALVFLLTQWSQTIFEDEIEIYTHKTYSSDQTTNPEILSQKWACLFLKSSKLVFWSN